MRLLWFDYIFSQLTFPLIVTLLIVSSKAVTISDNSSPSSLSSSEFVDLFYSDSNDRNIRHPVSHLNQPELTNNQQVIYINHGNGAISSIRRSSNQKLPFSPHVTSYPSSVFDNNHETGNFKLEPIPLVNDENPFNDSNRDSESEIDHHHPPSLSPPPPPPSLIQPNRRPSRRSATPTDTNKPSRLIYDPQSSNLSPPSQPPSQSPPSTVSSLKPLPLSNRSPPPPPPPLSHPRPPIRGPLPTTDPFVPFNFDNLFTRDQSFDIERNIIGNQDNPPSPPRPRPRPHPSPLTSHRARFQNNDNESKPPPPPSIGDNDLSRIHKLEDGRTTAEPRVRKQVPNTGSPPPSAYSGRPSIPPVTTPSPPPPSLLGPIGGVAPLQPTLGGEEGNGFIPSYGPPGFGLPGGQDIFPFFETPFLPISPTSSSNDGFQRRRLSNNYHNHNNLGGAYGSPGHHSSSQPPPPPPSPPPSSSLNNINDNSIGNGAGYPSYTIYKGGDDDDAGGKWPKIFKFTDGRVNLSEFERNKKSGKIKFHNKEDAYFDDIRRDSFLILHGGTYN